jgi:hypothetical protein
MTGLVGKEEGQRPRTKPKKTWKEGIKIGDKGIRYARVRRGLIWLRTRPSYRVL